MGANERWRLDGPPWSDYVEDEAAYLRGQVGAVGSGLRGRGDAVLIGASNLRADDPDLALAPEEREQWRAGGKPLPARIVITRRGEGLSPGAKMFDPTLGGPSYVVHAATMPQATRDA